MNTKIIAGSFGMLAFLVAVPVFAQGTDIGANVRAGARVGSTTVEAQVNANMQTRIAAAKQRANQEIERRIQMLTQLTTRTQAMRRVSDIGQASVSGAVEAQIAALNQLRARIEADADIETLRTDIQSISQSYRIFALVVPQGRIQVAADKIQTTADSFATFSVKLQERVSAAQTSGNDVTELSRLLSDMIAKIADAKAEASAAVSLVANLQPDGGDKTVQESNAAALREARADIQMGLASLQDARKDAGDIVKGLKTFGARADVSSDASTNVQ